MYSRVRGGLRGCARCADRAGVLEIRAEQGDADGQQHQSDEDCRQRPFVDPTAQGAHQTCPEWALLVSADLGTQIIAMGLEELQSCLPVTLERLALAHRQVLQRSWTIELCQRDDQVA